MGRPILLGEIGETKKKLRIHNNIDDNTDQKIKIVMIPGSGIQFT
jgi:hypothetical protein